MKAKLMTTMMITLFMAGMLNISVVSAAAQKLDLREPPYPGWEPPYSYDPTWPLSGFVILNNAADKLVIVVSLKEGDANTVYGVFLEWYSSPTDIVGYTEFGDLTTNIQGKGNFETELSLLPGTYYVQIAVGGWWSFKTKVVAVTIK
jgi:hypothetical protein